MAEKYLLDSNIFITPHRLYYPFDFAEGFWNQLEEKLKLDSVTVLDVVVAEVSKLEDELSSWLENLEDFETLSVKSPAIVTNYGKVLSKDMDWIVDARHMAVTDNAYFMHCLPVRRNMIVADEVIDSPQSIVIPEAANRVVSAQVVLKRMLESL